MSGVMIYQPVPTNTPALQTILSDPDQALFFAELFTQFSGPFLTVDHVEADSFIEYGTFSDYFRSKGALRNAYKKYRRSVHKLREEVGVWHENHLIFAGKYHSIAGNYLCKKKIVIDKFRMLIEIMYGRDVAITSPGPIPYTIRVSKPSDIEELHFALNTIVDDVPATLKREQTVFLRMCKGCIKRKYSFMCNEE